MLATLYKTFFVVAAYAVMTKGWDILTDFHQSKYGFFGHTDAPGLHVLCFAGANAVKYRFSICSFVFTAITFTLWYWHFGNRKIDNWTDDTWDRKIDTWNIPFNVVFWVSSVADPPVLITDKQNQTICLFNVISLIALINLLNSKFVCYLISSISVNCARRVG